MRAVVIGASVGLGAHFARCLCAAGASVVLAARRADRLRSLRDELEAAGPDAGVTKLDVQSSESVAAASRRGLLSTFW